MIAKNGSVMAYRLPPKCVPTALRLNRPILSSTTASRKSSDRLFTRMPAPRNGGHHFMPFSSWRALKRIGKS